MKTAEIDLATYTPQGFRGAEDVSRMRRLAREAEREADRFYGAVRNCRYGIGVGAAAMPSNDCGLPDDRGVA